MKLGQPLLICSALLLQACWATSGPEIRHHDLRPTPPAAGSDQLPLRLKLEPFFVRGGRNRLEFTLRSGTGSQLGWRNYHRWVRRPSEMVDNALLEGLRARQAFLEVEQAGLPPGPDLVLTGEITAFEQIYERPELTGASEVLIELKAELSSRGPTLSPELRRFESRGLAPVGARDVEGDRADVAVAAQLALEQAVARLSEQVIEQASSFRAVLPGPEPSGPVLLDLQVEPPAIEPLDGSLSIRVNRLRVAGALDRLEVLSRQARHRLEARADLRWQRRPSDVMQDGVVALLRAGGLAVLRPAQQGREDLRLDGYLRKFELDETGAVPEAVVELEVSVEAVVGLVRGRSPIADGSPDQVAVAFEAAIRSALGGVPAVVREAAAAAVPGAAHSNEFPEPRFLLVEPKLPVVSSTGLQGSVRVLRLEVRSDLDRSEVLVKAEGPFMELRREFLWQRRPAQRVTSALEAALRSAQGQRGKVGGPLSPGEYDFELGGKVTAYQLRRQEGSWLAEVSVSLELSRAKDGPLENERRTLQVRTISASGAAPVAALESGAIASGMGQALSSLLENVSMQVLEQVQDLAGDA